MKEPMSMRHAEHAWQAESFRAMYAGITIVSFECGFGMCAYLGPFVKGRSASFAFPAHDSQNSCTFMSGLTA